MKAGTTFVLAKDFQVIDRSGDSITLPPEVADILIEQGIIRLDD